MINKPMLALVVSVLSVSAAAVIIVTCSAPALLISLYRMIFTTLLIVPFIIVKGYYRTELMSLSKKSIILLVLIGFILAIHFALWISSLRLTSVASSVILVTAHPIFVGPLSYFLFKEHLSKTNIIGILTSLIGVIVLVFGNYGVSDLYRNTFEGNMLAFLGGIAAGLYILGGRYFRKQLSVITYVFIVYGVATVFLFAFCIIAQVSLIQISSYDLSLIFLMAIVSGLFGHTVYNWSLRHVKASLASVALLGEPIGSSLFALLLPWIHQIPSHYTIVGGAIIFVGIYLTARQ